MASGKLTPEDEVRLATYRAEQLGYERARWLLRGVVCHRCSGIGVRTYPSTATWRSDPVAGRAMTPGVCDLCWGSGLEDQPWPSHRLLEQAARTHGRKQDP